MIDYRDEFSDRRKLISIDSIARVIENLSTQSKDYVDFISEGFYYFRKDPKNCWKNEFDCHFDLFVNLFRGS